MPDSDDSLAKPNPPTPGEFLRSFLKSLIFLACVVAALAFLMTLPPY